ncbi:MAG: heme biosynthesis HemY N-terminal domain-containing protein [Oceanococcaceae bacterium]
MLRLLLILGVALVGGALAAVLLRDSPGYVLIEAAGYQIETTLAAVIVLTVISLVALILSWRILRGVWRAPVQLGQALESRRLERARTQYERGLLALRSERWQSAEMNLLKHVSDAPAPALSYLAAAEAAHHQGALQRRDEYLALALQQDDAAKVAIEMARARWLADAGEPAAALEALETVEGCRGHSPQAVQTLRLQLLEQQGDWLAVSQALPQSLGALPRPALDAIHRRAERALLETAAQEGTLEQLRQRWQGLSKPLRFDAEFLQVYTRGLQRLGGDAEALRLIGAHLKSHWDAELVARYAELHSDDPVAKLAHAEQWLKQHGEQHELLLLAGRLCIENRLWGRARSYLESCQRLRPDARVALEIGRLKLLEQDTAGALNAFRDGLERAVAGPPDAPADASQDPTRALPSRVADDRAITRSLSS